jgi:hypothetical protein
MDTQVIIVEVCENIAGASVEKANVTFKVENYVDKNTLTSCEIMTSLSKLAVQLKLKLSQNQ